MKKGTLSKASSTPPLAVKASVAALKAKGVRTVIILEPTKSSNAKTTRTFKSVRPLGHSSGKSPFSVSHCDVSSAALLTVLWPPQVL